MESRSQLSVAFADILLHYKPALGKWVSELQYCPRSENALNVPLIRLEWECDESHE